MIRPLGPFTVRPLRLATVPRRSMSPAADHAEQVVSITPARRPVKAAVLRLTGEQRVIGKHDATP